MAVSMFHEEMQDENNTFGNEEFRESLFQTLKTTNVLIFLPKEWDRTNLGACMIKHLAGDIERGAHLGGKNSIYIMSSVESLLKRAEHVTLVTGLRVGCFTEHFDHDTTSVPAWEMHLENFQVLFMLPATYLHALRLKHISAEGANVIVFDDCNHNVYRTDMFKIMTEFVNRIEKENRPRILAMSTTPINPHQFSSALAIETEFKKLENIYGATVKITKECYSSLGLDFFPI